MLLAIAILAALGTLAVAYISVMAAGMSDDPSESLDYKPFLISLCITALLWAGWYFGW
jgi:hypothetical protein